jgi:hypothetical protein
MLRGGKGHFRNWHALSYRNGSGEKKGDLPRDKAPHFNVRNGSLRLAVTFFETLNTSGSVNQFLFAGVERMASGANLGVDLFFGGACLE